MALAPGVRLGPYEVTAQFGVGGKRGTTLWRCSQRGGWTCFATWFLPIGLA